MCPEMSWKCPGILSSQKCGNPVTGLGRQLRQRTSTYINLLQMLVLVRLQPVHNHRCYLICVTFACISMRNSIKMFVTVPRPPQIDIASCAIIPLGVAVQDTSRRPHSVMMKLRHLAFCEQTIPDFADRLVGCTGCAMARHSNRCQSFLSFIRTQP